jgi:2-keto-4-pentenoate hydratase
MTTSPHPLAAVLANATRSGRRVAVDDAFRALERPEAMQVQADTAAALGTGVSGWKVAIPDDVPAYAPMFTSAVRVGAQTNWPLHEEGYLVEIEIGVRLSADLPARPGKPYRRDELVAAISEAFVGIELIGSRLKNSPGDAPFPAWLADNMGNGAYAVGPSVAYASIGSRIDALRCMVQVDGATVHDQAGHPLGDPLRPVLACLNDQTDRLGGYKAGQIVTTGSLNKPYLLTGPGRIDAEIDGIGTMVLTVG